MSGKLPRSAFDEGAAMIVDHVGIVVRALDEGADHWKKVFGYSRSTDPVTNERQMVRVVFLSRPGSLDVKLIEPTSEHSPVYQFARKGGGLHHLCMRCENVEREVQRCESLGLRVLSQAQPGEAFENQPIAFLYDNHGLNVELIDTLQRAHRLGRSDRGENDH